MDRSSLVTVAVPTFNRCRYLGAALTMILSQSYDNLQVVVRDDGSTDETVEVLTSINDERLTWSSARRNEGIPAALNVLLDQSHGEFIIYLHDHDEFAPGLVATLVECLASDPSAGVANPGIAWVDDDGRNFLAMDPLPASTVFPGQLAQMYAKSGSYDSPLTACCLVRRAAYASVGAHFSEEYGFVSDVDMWLRISMAWRIVQASGVQLVCRRRSLDHDYAGPNPRVAGWLGAIDRANSARLMDAGLLSPREAKRYIRRKAHRELFHAARGSLRTRNFMGVFETAAVLSPSLPVPERAIGRLRH